MPRSDGVSSMGTSDATLCLGFHMRFTIVSLLTTFESSLSNIIGAIRITGATVLTNRHARFCVDAMRRCDQSCTVCR